jgi:hypothetical protein
MVTVHEKLCDEIVVVLYSIIHAKKKRKENSKMGARRPFSCPRRGSARSEQSQTRIR